MLPDSGQQNSNFKGKLLVEKYFEGKVAQMKIDDKIINDRKKREVYNIKKHSGSGIKAVRQQICEVVNITKICIDAGADQGPTCYYETEELCYTIDLPDLPQLPGTGGPVTNPGPTDEQEQENLREAKDLEVHNYRKNDCDAILLAQRRAKLTDLKTAIERIKDKNIEYINVIRTSNKNNSSSLIIDYEYSNQNSKRVTATPHWNATNGYILGFSHNHPEGSAPSPTDVFNTSLNILEMVHNNNITRSELANYMNNFTSIVVSKGSVYTISIKNGVGYMGVKDSGFYRPIDHSKYSKLASDYITKNNLDEEILADRQEAGEYAILKLYGDIINITKHNIGEESNSQILKIDNSTKKVEKEKPC